MTGKPKNRRINLTRSRVSTPPSRESREGGEIPRGSLVEIRRLIEEASYGSQTEIATRLNADRFPTASGVDWTAALVDSALRRQDMSDLKETLRENRGEEDQQSPEVSSLAIKQAAYDGAKEAVKDLALKMPEIPPLKVDTFTIKGAVADAVNTALKGVSPQARIDVSAFNTEIFKVVSNALTQAKLPYIQRMTEATSRNVGEVSKRIDKTCEELYDSVKGGFEEHGEKINDLVEGMVHEVYARIDTRFDALEDNVVKKLVEEGGVEEALTKIVDERLKIHMDEVMNRFAIMVGNLKRDLTGAKSRVPGKY